MANASDTDQAFATSYTNQAYFVFAADVDGDSDVDALSVSNRAKAAVWFENDGGESFAHHALPRVAKVPAPLFLDERRGPS